MQACSIWRLEFNLLESYHKFFQRPWCVFIRLRKPLFSGCSKECWEKTQKNTRKIKRLALTQTHWQLCALQAVVDQYFKVLWRWISLFDIFPGSENHSKHRCRTNLPDRGPHNVPCMIHKLCMRPSGALSACRVWSSPTQSEFPKPCCIITQPFCLSLEILCGNEENKALWALNQPVFQFPLQRTLVPPPPEAYSPSW